MNDAVPISGEVVAWLKRLLLAEEIGDGWDTSYPPPDYPEVADFHMVEERNGQYRLTDIGRWMLRYAVAKGHL